MKKILKFTTLILTILSLLILPCCKQKEVEKTDEPPSRFEVKDEVGSLTENEYKFQLKADGKNSDYLKFAPSLEDFKPNLHPTFNKNLALTALLSSYISEGKDLTFHGKNQDFEIYSFRDYYSLLGFKTYNYKSVSSNEVSLDKHDLCGAYLGYTSFTSTDGKTYETVICTINGYTEGGGWQSNFDVGADTSSYYELTGSHPDWQNKKHHKGFDIATNRIYGVIKNYINEKATVNENFNILITGHSRGAAISNLLAKKFKDENINSVAYCFNTPNVTTETDETVLKSYDNIFSIVNGDDIVSIVPSNSWSGFTAYGNELTYKISSNPERWETVFNQYYSSLSSKQFESVKSFLKGLVDTRDNIYEFEEGKATVEYYDTADKALARKQEILELLGNEKQIQESVKIEITATDKGFKVTIENRPALVIFVASKLLSEDIDLDYNKLLPLVDKYISNYKPLITSIMLSPKKISLPHEVFTPFIGIENL